ncbi:family 1 glycosylhydrolase [Cyanobium sp. ATX-6F1]|uniref:family 1 glycosylhydrolase n=1 Tax=Cyanobium sp. ATX-6F1 TaxID=3137388 RepID=UPI0039BE799D
MDDPSFQSIPANPFITPVPTDFLWGVATAAYQVEGHTSGNDWARFETIPGMIKGGARSGAAADHWNRVSEDVGLIKALGANAHRFSIEWSRLEPAPGHWDQRAWDHYADEIAQLRAVGIEPMLTLLHFHPARMAGGARRAGG